MYSNIIMRVPLYITMPSAVENTHCDVLLVKCNEASRNEEDSRNLMLEVHYHNGLEIRLLSYNETYLQSLCITLFLEYNVSASLCRTIQPLITLGAS